MDEERAAPATSAETAGGTRGVLESVKSALRGVAYIAAAIGLAIGIRVYVAGQFVVRGDSMLGALADGDRMLVDRVTLKIRDPQRGEIVIVAQHLAAGAEQDLVKRVIAVGGETVQVRSCTVYVDGQLLAEPYLDTGILEQDGCGPDQQPLLVPDGEVYVLGDHRGRSSDSRFFGTVPVGDLVGKAVLRLWPPSRWGRLGN